MTERDLTAALKQADDTASDRLLGASVKLLRLKMGLSIHKLAERAGLSVGIISQLERGLATPSLRTLRTLSVALAVPISAFFEKADETAEPSYIVRRSARPMLRLLQTGIIKESLAPTRPGHLEMYELTLGPDTSSGGNFARQEGEKAGYVLDGQLRLWLNHIAHLLDPGDTFRFPSNIPHMFDNPTTSPARVIWLTYPILNTGTS